MNIQPIEKRAGNPGLYLDVHSVFLTIQGEGPFCGVPCVFVRLAGCNLQCPACDTEYTDGRKTMHMDELLALVCDTHTLSQHPMEDRLVVVTGGEPFRQNLDGLFEALCSAGFYVQVETNGTLKPTSSAFATNWSYSIHPMQRRGVYVVCSPKTGKIQPDIYKVACALKYVVRAGQVLESDGLPLSALDHPSNPYPARPLAHWDRPIYVQPLDSKDPVENAAHAREAVASCLRHGYTLQVQVHKFVGVE